MRFIYFNCCSKYSSNLKKLVEKFCNDQNIYLMIYDSDEDPDILLEYNIRKAPALLVLDGNDTELARLVGKFTEEDLKKIL